MKLVVLTKSAKRRNDGINYGNCVSGKNEHGEWIRLVADEEGDSLLDSDCRMFNCLDVIDVDATHCPLNHQSENFILERFNGKVKTFYSISDVVKKVGEDEEQFCFINNNYLLNETEILRAEKSLMLIRVQNLEIYVSDNGKTKARFTYNREIYTECGITDNRHRNTAQHDEAYIVASLPPDTGGYRGYYKFIAAVYPIE